jgi:hypothetical protein
MFENPYVVKRRRRLDLLLSPVLSDASLNIGNFALLSTALIEREKTALQHEKERQEKGLRRETA